MMDRYAEELVTAVYIDGMHDWNDIVTGSFSTDEIKVQETKRACVTAIDKFSGDTIFFFADHLKAVRYRTEDNPSPVIQPEDNRQLP